MFISFDSLVLYVGSGRDNKEACEAAILRLKGKSQKNDFRVLNKGLAIIVPFSWL